MSKDFDLDESYDEPVILDFNIIKNNIKDYSSEKLSEMIVCNNYFNINEDITMLCMQELSFRRSNGDNFDFESYIKTCSSELPALNVEPTYKNIFWGIR